MSVAARAAELLSRRLGLSAELLRGGVIERALEVVFAGAASELDESGAVRLLEGEGEEWQKLVDEVVVPETWFFRHHESFRFLAAYAAKGWRPGSPARLFKALCIPCASGEEPYSVAMTLLEAGLEESRIRIDAADISERLLARARLGVYGKASFREKGARLPEEYFLNSEEGRRVREEVVRLVRFEKANFLDVSRFRQSAPYDAIFCRNALIYLHKAARREVVRRMRELLDEEGVLFTGPAELTHFCAAGYVPVDRPQSFACRRGEPARAPGRSAPAVLAAPTARRVPKARAVPAPEPRRSPVSCPPPEPSANLEQAERLADRGDLAAAAALCRQLLQEDAQNPSVYALLGVIHESEGKAEGAEECFRKALYLAPNHYEALLHMSLLCERRGDAESSRLYRARAARALARQEGKQVLKSL